MSLINFGQRVTVVLRKQRSPHDAVRVLFYDSQCKAALRSSGALFTIVCIVLRSQS